MIRHAAARRKWRAGSLWSGLPGAVLILLVVASLAGCGGSGSSTISTPRPISERSRPGPVRDRQSSAKRQSARTRRAFRNVSAVRAKGRRDCADLLPLAAARLYSRAAHKAGVKQGFIEFVAEPKPSTLHSAGFPRLAAALYAQTLPVKQQAAAAAGCAEELAR